jgi:hypothetical protein
MTDKDSRRIFYFMSYVTLAKALPESHYNMRLR